MCTNHRLVHTSSGKDLYLPCGVCPACQQAAANKRQARIKNHCADKDYFSVFFTLTYSNNFLPFVRLSDRCRFAEFYDKDDDLYKVPVYRRYTLTNGISGKSRFIRSTSSIGTFSLQNSPYYVECYHSDYGLRSPVGFPDYDSIGICYTPDFTNFIKRLQQNLLYYYGIQPQEFSYFRCSEYGPTTLRPHFHGLLFFPKSYKTMFGSIRRAIVASWPYASVSRTRRYVEKAIDPSGYISSYVNRGSSFPDLFKILSIRPKTSSSQNFGFGNVQFSLASVLKGLHTDSLRYSCSSIDKNKVPVTLVLPLPKYVLHRYFPYIKGLSRLNDSQVRDFISHFWRCPKEAYYRFSTVLNWSDEDFAVFRPRLLHKIEYYILHTKSTVYDYSLDFVRCRNLAFGQSLFDSFSDVRSYKDLPLHYTNFDDYLLGLVSSDIPIGDDVTLGNDYNDNPYVVLRTQELTDSYNKHLKRSKFNEQVTDVCSPA